MSNPVKRADAPLCAEGKDHEFAPIYNDGFSCMNCDADYYDVFERPGAHASVVVTLTPRVAAVVRDLLESLRAGRKNPIGVIADDHNLTPEQVDQVITKVASNLREGVGNSA
jgi:hypothetical protein